ncbi:DUF488 family protein [Chloroflexota bacterium]
MATIFTIGYTKKSLEQFIHHLQEAEVDAVIDVRLRNTSQLAGFAKRDDLAYLLRGCFGIEYEHRPDLAPTPDIREAYKVSGDWAVYERSFLAHLEEGQAEDTGRELLAQFERPCLLCAEPVADQCHRRLVAEWWEKHLPSIQVAHL